MRPRTCLRVLRLLSYQLLGLAAAGSLHLAAGQTPGGHPLDALTADEHWVVFDTLRASGRVDGSTHFAGILLKEPPKAEVLAWKPGQPFRREALVIVVRGKQVAEVIVEVHGKRIRAWKGLKDVMPPLTREESREAGDMIKEEPQWQAAARKRGITDYRTVDCIGLTPGYFGTPEEQGRRLARVICFDQRYGANVAGLIAVWDLGEKKLIRLIDTGPVPQSSARWDYDLDSVGPLRPVSPPLVVEQPQGAGFRVDGTQVQWQKWSFHFRTDPRVGVIVSTVKYKDSDRDRSILYQGSLSEIFVPYMDPSEGWYHWTFLDSGETFAATGGLPNVLERGTDCPDYAVYFSSVFADANGVPRLRPNTACLFERFAGDFAWRHLGDGRIESRPQRDLVLRMIANVGVYDYVFDWIFQQDGTLKVSAGATGIDETKVVRSRTFAEDGSGQDSAYGRFIAENIVGVNHDHFFSFRLDLDVDGTANSFVRDKLVAKRLPADHPRKSLWVVEQEIPRSEQGARLHMIMEKPEIWRVINPSVKSPLGYPVSYQIRPGHNAMTLLSPDDYPRRRAGFIDHHIWVTAQRDDERYAAGDYPAQSRGGDGLPTWTSGDRVIQNTDIVVWYTLGFHHLPRAEDFPVMPTTRHEFELRPFDFFNRNPALDLRKQP